MRENEGYNWNHNPVTDSNEAAYSEAVFTSRATINPVLALSSQCNGKIEDRLSLIMGQPRKKALLQ